MAIQQRQEPRRAMVDNSLFSTLPEPLFRPRAGTKARASGGDQPQGLRTGPKYEVTFEFGGEEIQLFSWSILSTSDQSVLLALLRLGVVSPGARTFRAAEKPARPVDPSGAKVYPESRLRALDATTREAEVHYAMYDLFESLDPTGKGAGEKPRIYIEASAHEIMKEAGLATGYDYIDRLAEIFERLHRVGYSRRSLEGNQRRFRSGEALLSYDLKDDDTLRIALSERLVRAIAGEVSFTMVDLDERSQLKTETAKLLHTALSMRIRAGKSAKKKVNGTLVPMIFGSEPCSKRTLQWRRQQVRKALTQIAEQFPERWQIGLAMRPGHDFVAEITRAREGKPFKSDVADLSNAEARDLSEAAALPNTVSERV